MIPPANAAKAWLVHEGRVLLLRRRPNDVHQPSAWDIPGGRLSLGESPHEGLVREMREEIGITATIDLPLEIHHFTRQDGQVITMMVFLCHPQSSDIILSEEHTEYRWVPVRGDDPAFPDWMHSIVRRYRQWMGTGAV
ncbi:NUDIX domain-containing protein [Candidatus Uhrbacteria bacterium]|nr:NUDIX domain-containing protein [Candidatus Uhrbacteria bacterium]